MALRGSGGHLDGADISAYVDEELSSRDTARVDAHLQTCDSCRELADDLRATKTLVSEMPVLRAPRDFTLGPEFALVARPAAPPRRWFNFMPAVAMSAALLVLLVFVDVSSLGSSSDGSSAGVSSSAGRTMDEAAKSSADSQAAAPPVPRAAQPGSAGGNTQGFAPTPQAATAGAAPGGTPVPLQAAAPPLPPPGPVTPFAAPALAPAAPSPAPAVASEAARGPTPARDVSPRNAGDAKQDDDGLDILRILEVVAGVVLLGSLLGLYLQRRAASR